MQLILAYRAQRRHQTTRRPQWKKAWNIARKDTPVLIWATQASPKATPRRVKPARRRWRKTSG